LATSARLVNFDLQYEDARQQTTKISTLSPQSPRQGTFIFCGLFNYAFTIRTIQRRAGRHGNIQTYMARSIIKLLDIGTGLQRRARRRKRAPPTACRTRREVTANKPVGELRDYVLREKLCSPQPINWKIMIRGWKT
jgi:hypothetical protein